MAISLASLSRSTAIAAPRILIHGVAGVGKSTFAAATPSPVFVPTEDGLGMLDVAHFPLARSFEAVMEALVALYSEPHEFQTVVVDSVDWLEPLIWQRVCQDNQWASIEEPGYGKGYFARRHRGRTATARQGGTDHRVIPAAGALVGRSQLVRVPLL